MRAGGGFGDKGKGEGKVKGKSKGKRMEINVKTQAGENITMDFEASDTIDNVKARMPTTLQSPDIHVMVPVEGGRTLADLGLVVGDSLFVFGGGGGPKIFDKDEEQVEEVEPSESSSASEERLPNPAPVPVSARPSGENWRA